MPSPSDLRAGIRALGLAGLPVCVHSSLRSFGIGVRVEAADLMRTFLDEGCTLMVPSYSDDFAVWQPDDQRPPRNGTEYDRPRRPYPGAERIYSTDCTRSRSPRWACCRPPSRPGPAGGGEIIRSDPAAPSVPWLKL